MEEFETISEDKGGRDYAKKIICSLCYTSTARYGLITFRAIEKLVPLPERVLHTLLDELEHESTIKVRR